MAASSSMQSVISGLRPSIQRPIPNPPPSKSGGLAMAHRGRRKRSSFFPMKIRGRKKSASFAVEVGVVAGVKDEEAGAEAEVAGSVDEDMIAPIVIHHMIVDGAVVVVEHVGIMTTIIAPTKGIITMGVVTVGGVDLAVEIRDTTINTSLQGIVNDTTNATISLRRMGASTNSSLRTMVA